MIVPFSHVRNIFTPEWSSCLKIIKKFSQEMDHEM